MIEGLFAGMPTNPKHLNQPGDRWHEPESDLTEYPLASPSSDAPGHDDST